jgi:hypothetical protein
MQASKPYYFYLWRHRYIDDTTNEVVSRTCFGITGNIDDRRNGYEGHVGHTVKFERVWSSTEPRIIRDLESRVKVDFDEYLVRGHRNYRYEWINESIPFEDVVKYVEWEVSRLIGVESIEL